METTITFPVPWLPMLIGLGITGLLCGIRKVRARSRKRKAIAKVERRREIQALFPSPWDEAYEQCCQIIENPASRLFIKKWLKGHNDLPLLSSIAVHALACELTFEYCERWTECLIILAPYDARGLSAAGAVEEKENDIKAKELKEKQSLFQYPWEKAYDACRISDTFKGTQLWLQKWISEQDSLPSLSLEAAEELMSEVAEQESAEYKVYFDLLAPYLDTKNYDLPRNLADYHLRDRLPTEWYAFWTKIKNYPERRVLFLESLRKGVHPGFGVPLTVDEASLLSRALGNGDEAYAAFYGADLAKFVSMGEDRSISPPTGCSRRGGR